MARKARRMRGSGDEPEPISHNDYWRKQADLIADRDDVKSVEVDEVDGRVTQIVVLLRTAGDD